MDRLFQPASKRDSGVDHTQFPVRLCSRRTVGHGPWTSLARGDNLLALDVDAALCGKRFAGQNTSASILLWMPSAILISGARRARTGPPATSCKIGGFNPSGHALGRAAAVQSSRPVAQYQAVRGASSPQGTRQQARPQRSETFRCHGAYLRLRRWGARVRRHHPDLRPRVPRSAVMSDPATKRQAYRRSPQSSG